MHHLQHCTLDGCFSDACAEVLAPALSSRSSLATLSIERCAEWGVQGLTPLLSALRIAPCLRKVLLQPHGGCRFLARASDATAVVRVLCQGRLQASNGCT